MIAFIYSKIESNKQELRFSELIDFIDQTDITPEEFFEHFNEEQTQFRKLFKAASENISNKKIKLKLLSFCFNWEIEIIFLLLV